MSLSLVVGPPNAGRAGAILRRFGEALDHDPLLVVPTRDDVDRFERELVAGRRRVLGGSIGTFRGTLRGGGARRRDRPPGASHGRTATVARPRGGRRGRHPGAAGIRSLTGLRAVDGTLLGELQSEGLDPETLERRAADARRRRRLRG